MISKDDAVAIVNARLAEVNLNHLENPRMLTGKVVEMPFGWVFYYTSQKFLETGQTRYRLAGNGPIIVDKEDGCVKFCGSKPPIEARFEKYQLERRERLAKKSE